MKIWVTKKHIENGEREQYSTCPIALAISEKTGLYCEVSAYNGVARVVLERGPGEAENCYWQEMGDEAYFFIRDFDDGKPVKPLALELKEDDWERCNDE